MDIRKNEPYSIYGKLNFDVPVGDAASREAATRSENSATVTTDTSCA